MKISTARQRLLASTIMGGVAVMAAAQANAQAAAASAAGGNQVEAIVITGSRIPQPNLTSVSPIQSVTSQEFQLQGKTDTVDLLNNLPQVTQNDVADFSSTSNALSSPGGVATVDLRGLGPQRTLVLVDGRRLGIGDPNTGNTNPAPDINQIPSQLIQRVEVLTGGASSTYGSDAVAGVVNFIMKRDFQGVQVDAQYGENEHHQHNDYMQGLEAAKGIKGPKSTVWDGQSRDLSFIAGANGADGKANVTAYFTYHNQDPVTQHKRDYSACQLNVTAAGVGSCAGSSSSNLFYSADGTFAGRYAVVGNTFAPYSTTAATSPPPLFNSNDYSYLSHQDSRYLGGFFARYDINKNVNLYSDFSYMNDRSRTEVAPSGLFQSIANVNCNNPLLSAQQVATICTPAMVTAANAGDYTKGSTSLFIGRRNIEGGGRESDYEHQNYRAVIGARGDIVDGWKYDVYYQYYYTTLYQANTNYLSLSRIQNALQVVNVAGKPACISGAPCVPWNIFSTGGVTPDQIAYLNSLGSEYGATSERIAEASVTGDLGTYGLRSPLAKDGVGIALGVQSRRDHLKFTPDEASQSGDLSGFGGAAAAINNGLNVKEAFGEIRVPLAQDAPFVHDLLFEGGYRYSDYSTSISTNTYKLGLQWAPTTDIRFRGSYQQAIRAPNIIELYNPQVVTNSSQLAVDPCSPTTSASGALIAATATLAQCQRTGVTAAQYGNGGTTSLIPQCPSGQCATSIGGNPNLDAERAKTFSVGFNFTPSFFRGLTASVDYFHIKIDGEVSTVPLGVAMSNCLNTGDPTFCSLIKRGPSGFLFGTTLAGGGYVVGTNVNVGAALTSGIDLQATYRTPIEGVSFDFVGSYLAKSTFTPLPGQPTYDCAGLFGPQCQTVAPRWRHTLRLNADAPYNVLVSVAWRFIGGTLNEADSNQPTIGTGTTSAFNHRLPAVSYFDLTALWKMNTMFSFRAGVTNIFDKDPPLVRNGLASTGLPNTFTTYDLLGRRLFAGITANF